MTWPEAPPLAAASPSKGCGHRLNALGGMGAMDLREAPHTPHSGRRCTRGRIRRRGRLKLCHRCGMIVGAPAHSGLGPVQHRGVCLDIRTRRKPCRIGAGCGATPAQGRMEGVMAPLIPEFFGSSASSRQTRDGMSLGIRGIAAADDAIGTYRDEFCPYGRSTTALWFRDKAGVAEVGGPPSNCASRNEAGLKQPITSTAPAYEGSAVSSGGMGAIGQRTRVLCRAFGGRRSHE